MAPEPGSWRAIAQPIIARIVAEHGGVNSRPLRAALGNAYPFGERKYWPYKVWCDEVRRALHGGPPPRRRPDGLSAKEYPTPDLFAGR
jgi:hypothetical protein